MLSEEYLRKIVSYGKANYYEMMALIHEIRRLRALVAKLEETAKLAVPVTPEPNQDFDL